MAGTKRERSVFLDLLFMAFGCVGCCVAAMQVCDSNVHSVKILRQKLQGQGYAITRFYDKVTGKFTKINGNVKGKGE
jgi:hypothetical protein